jgi:uncharacterized membrane protein
MDILNFFIDFILKLIVKYPMDAFAYLIFLICWQGYSLYFTSLNGIRDGLFSAMEKSRSQWVTQIMQRSDKNVDIKITSEIARNSQLLARSCLFIFALPLTLLVKFDDISFSVLIMTASSELPTELPLILKISFIMLIFAYTFFKSIWVGKQFENIEIVIGGIKVYEKKIASNEEGYDNNYNREYDRVYDKMNNLISNGVRHNNLATVSYCFGFIGFTWFLSPYVLIFTSIFVWLVLYRREFRSKALDFVKASNKAIRRRKSSKKKK